MQLDNPGWAIHVINSQQAAYIGFASLRRGFSRLDKRTCSTLALTPGGLVSVLILTTLLGRVVFGELMGLGIDESYMAAGSRTLQLSYYDHPPIAWWLAWAAEHTSGRASDVGIRLPFILLFALSTWLMYRLGTTLYGARAGLWAAIGLNAAPVLGVTTATWVLPDGPLVAALLGGTLCLAHALQANR